MSLPAHYTAISADSATEIRAARQADYVAFLYRVPFAIDALSLGYVTGFREDCSYQHTQYETLEELCGEESVSFPARAVFSRHVGH